MSIQLVSLWQNGWTLIPLLRGQVMSIKILIRKLSPPPPPPPAIVFLITVHSNKFSNSITQFLGDHSVLKSKRKIQKSNTQKETFLNLILDGFFSSLDSSIPINLPMSHWKIWLGISSCQCFQRWSHGSSSKYLQRHYISPLS